MKKLLFVGGILLSLTLILIFSDYSINPEIEVNSRSLDESDFPSKQNLILKRTEIGDKYINPFKKTVGSSNWKESHIAIEQIIPNKNVQQNVTFEFFSEMPTPPQHVLDKFEEKFQNPKPRKTPMMSSSTNELDPILDGAINIDEFLNKEKKS